MRYLLLILILLISCTGVEKENTVRKKTDSSDVEEPDQISWDIDVYFVDSSFTKAILHAKKARIYQKREETLLDSGLTVEFLSKTTGKRTSLLTAEQARIDDKTKNMLASGNVVVVSDSSGTTLKTSVLEWNNTTKKLYSTEFVTITSPYETIQGHGFESDPDLTNYKIHRVSGIQNRRDNAINKSGIK